MKSKSGDVGRSPSVTGRARRRGLGKTSFCGIEALESRQLLSLFTFFPKVWPYVPKRFALPVVKAQPAPKTPVSNTPSKTTTTTTTSTTPLSSSATTLTSSGVSSTPATAASGMTLLSQENFTSNVSASSPDAFDSVTGTLYSEVGGPTIPASAGTIGVSADPEQPTNVVQ